MLKRLSRYAIKILLNPLQASRYLIKIGGLRYFIGLIAGHKKWFQAYRPAADMLQSMRSRPWPENRPLLSVLMCVYNPQETWLRQALDSVLSQVYPHWELLCVDDNSSAPHVIPLLQEYAQKDSRIRICTLPKNGGVASASNAGLRLATGKYVCFMDHDDVLEPQALYRFAETILQYDPDILYSDEAITGENIDDIKTVLLRPAFSYDYYLSHPYFVHLVAIRRSIIETIGGFDEQFKISQDYDLVLRALVHAKTVAHVNDILYRWRTVKTSLGHQRMDEVMKMSVFALNRHLEQIGLEKFTATAGKSFNIFEIKPPAPSGQRVAIVIPTKDQPHLLRQCIDSLYKTIPAGLADIYVVDHDSREPETRLLLEDVKKRGGFVLPHSGPFNFSTINNAAIAKLKKTYPYYLFLNNDTEATEPGWLEHMVAIASRKDVGAVGALLLYPDRRVQHAGVLIGILNRADHAGRFEACYKMDGRRNQGYIGSLLAIRDYSAVTAACMLVKAEAFEKVSGYDENFAVGFGDTDLCLRIIAKNYRVLFDPYTVLIHHESTSRGKSVALDSHPNDSKNFLMRYANILESGDVYYNPLLDPVSFKMAPKPGARARLDTVVRVKPVSRPQNTSNHKPL